MQSKAMQSKERDKIGNMMNLGMKQAVSYELLNMDRCIVWLLLDDKEEDSANPRLPSPGCLNVKGEQFWNPASRIPTFQATSWTFW